MRNKSYHYLQSFLENNIYPFCPFTYHYLTDRHVIMWNNFSKSQLAGYEYNYNKCDQTAIITAQKKYFTGWRTVTGYAILKSLRNRILRHNFWINECIRNVFIHFYTNYYEANLIKILATYIKLFRVRSGNCFDILVSNFQIFEWSMLRLQENIILFIRYISKESRNYISFSASTGWFIFQGLIIPLYSIVVTYLKD